MSTALPDHSGEEEKILRVQTLGGFRVWRNGEEIPSSAWTRDKAVQLFQFFITMRQQAARLHKEAIIEQLWPDYDPDKGDRDFKVALNAVHKALEPERAPRSEPHFVRRYDLAYGLHRESVQIDGDAFEAAIAQGNQLRQENEVEAAIERYKRALAYYRGDYLPERRYEDWSSVERERLQVLALNLMTTLGSLLVDRSPLETIRLTERVLAIDPIWEDAYRTQMRAYIATGNRPLALRTYQRCVTVLAEELGIDPLPQTTDLYQKILVR
ncbi:MAG: bacterial transcriptional activator domain-containing protein [Caldilineaceae bacterium]|nr:bacterial transcriptional activator domain-containing protein [Caldilineaceae bacterium]